MSELEDACRELQKAMLDDLAKDRAEIMLLEKAPLYTAVALLACFLSFVAGAVLL